MYRCDNVRCGWIGNEDDLLSLRKCKDKLCPDCGSGVTEDEEHVVIDDKGVPGE